jgi:hypothetical protein
VRGDDESDDGDSHESDDECPPGELTVVRVRRRHGHRERDDDDASVPEHGHLGVLHHHLVVGIGLLRGRRGVSKGLDESRPATHLASTVLAEGLPNRGEVPDEYVRQCRSNGEVLTEV